MSDMNKVNGQAHHEFQSGSMVRAADQCMLLKAMALNLTGDQILSLSGMLMT